MKYKIFLMLCILLLFLYAILQVDLKHSFDFLKNLSFIGIVYLVILNACILFLNCWRWKILLYQENIKFLPLCAHRLSGFAMSFFTPGPQLGGEPLQIYLLKKHHHVATADAISSVVLDRMIEFVVNFTFLLLGIFLIMQQFSLRISLLESMVVPGFFFVACMLLLGAYFFQFRPLTRFITQFPLPSKITNTVTETEVIAGSFMRNSPGKLLLCFVISIVSWSFLIYEFWFSFYLLGCPLTFSELVFVLVANRLMLLLPLPGGLGVIESGLVATLKYLQIDPALGLSMAVLIRGRDLFLCAIGVWWAQKTWQP